MGRVVKLAFLGDINGAPGRSVLEKCLPALRERWAPDVVIANGENARNGSGLTPELYKAFRAMGIDALTLGDHVYRDPKIVPYLERPEEPVARPANLSARSPGKRFSRIPAANGRTRDIYVLTVLGRIFFPLPANDPFTAVDEVKRSSEALHASANEQVTSAQELAAATGLGLKKVNALLDIVDDPVKPAFRSFVMVLLDENELAVGLEYFSLGGLAREVLTALALPEPELLGKHVLEGIERRAVQGASQDAEGVTTLLGGGAADALDRP